MSGDEDDRDTEPAIPAPITEPPFTGGDAAADVIASETRPYPVSQVLDAGARVGPYVIEELIAAGGFGTVFRARHDKLGRLAALKVLHAELAHSPEAVERFRREAHAVNLIQHANVVDIFDVGVLDDGRPYFVMEYLEGHDLETQLAAHGPMNANEVLEVFDALCAALTATHAKGIVHRDIKASNVFMATYAAQTRIVLLDFGVAKLLDGGQSDLTTARHVVGTPTCMAPEQIRGEAVDGRTDVYALGALAFQLLTGAVAFGDESPAMMQHLHLTAAPPLPSQVATLDHDFDAVVARAMAKRREDRYADVGALLGALRRAVAATAPATPARVRLRGHKRVLAVYLGGSRTTSLDDLVATVIAGREQLVRRGFAVAIDGGDGVVLVRAVDDLGLDAARRRALTDVIETVDHLLVAESRPEVSLRVSVELCDAAFAGGRILGEALRRLYTSGSDRPDGAIHAGADVLRGLDDLLAVAPIAIREIVTAGRVD